VGDAAVLVTTFSKRLNGVVGKAFPMSLQMDQGGRKPGYDTYEIEGRITQFDELADEPGYIVNGDSFDYKDGEEGVIWEQVAELFANTNGLWSIVLVCIEFIILDIFDYGLFETRDVIMGWESSLLSVLIVTLQVLLMLYTGWTLVRDIADLNPISISRLINGWITFALGFSLVYLLIFIADPDVFHVDGWIGEIHERKIETNRVEGHVAGVLVGFVYYSLTVLTSVGFGDVTCRGWLAQFTCCLEMLIGVIFSVVIFGWALHYFQTQVGEDIVAEFRNEYHPGIFRRLVATIRHRVPGVEVVRKFIISYLLLVVIGIQFGTFGVLVMAEPELLAEDNVYKNRAFIALCCLQAFLLLLLCSVSLRIAFKMHDHMEVGLGFLVQSYLSIIVLFDGVYLLVFLVDKDSFRMPSAPDPAKISLLTAIWNFFYFSCTAMTTTGFGDITPRLMLGRAAVSCHLVISQVYHILILGLGTAIFVSRQQAGITKSTVNIHPSRSWGGNLSRKRRNRTSFW